jgi:hypothetical protein
LRRLLPFSQPQFGPPPLPIIIIIMLLLLDSSIPSSRWLHFVPVPSSLVIIILRPPLFPIPPFSQWPLLPQWQEIWPQQVREEEGKLIICKLKISTLFKVPVGQCWICQRRAVISFLTAAAHSPHPLFPTFSPPPIQFTINRRRQILMAKVRLDPHGKSFIYQYINCDYALYFQ